MVLDVLIKEKIMSTNHLPSHIEELVSSLYRCLSDAYNRFFSFHNQGIGREIEITTMILKGYLKSRQDNKEILSNIRVEYGILKEPFSESKNANEIQMKLFLDKEIKYEGDIKELEGYFETFIEEINKFDFFSLEASFYSKKWTVKFAHIDVEVKIGSKFFQRTGYL